MTITLELAPAVQAKLCAEAEAAGVPLELYVESLLRQWSCNDDFFLQEVQRGLQQIDLGQTLSHADVGIRLENLLVRKQAPA